MWVRVWVRVRFGVTVWVRIRDRFRIAITGSGRVSVSVRF